MTEVKSVTFQSTISGIPPIRSSTAKSNIAHCSRIPDYQFKRAGIIPYTTFEGELIFFFNIFSGDEDGKDIEAELSDFGGRVERESFLPAATNELFEESLGLFDFVGKEQQVSTVSHAVYVEDRTLIILFTPVELKCRPSELVSQFQRLKNLTDRKRVTKVDLRNMGRSMKPTLNMQVQRVLRTDVENTPLRKKKFNPEESTALIYIPRNKLLELIEGETVALPDDLDIPYDSYPQIYPIISRRLKETSVIGYL